MENNKWSCSRYPIRSVTDLTLEWLRDALAPHLGDSDIIASFSLERRQPPQLAKLTTSAVKQVRLVVLGEKGKEVRNFLIKFTDNLTRLHSVDRKGSYLPCERDYYVTAEMLGDAAAKGKAIPLIPPVLHSVWDPDPRIFSVVLTDFSAAYVPLQTDLNDITFKEVLLLVQQLGTLHSSCSRMAVTAAVEGNVFGSREDAFPKFKDFSEASNVWLAEFERKVQRKCINVVHTLVHERGQRFLQAAQTLTKGNHAWSLILGDVKYHTILRVCEEVMGGRLKECPDLTAACGDVLDKPEPANRRSSLTPVDVRALKEETCYSFMMSSFETVKKGHFIFDLVHLLNRVPREVRWQLQATNQVFQVYVDTRGDQVEGGVEEIVNLFQLGTMIDFAESVTMAPKMLSDTNTNGAEKELYMTFALRIAESAYDNVVPIFFPPPPI